MHRLNEHYTESKGLHLNYSIITDMIEAGKNVVDLGCGDGTLTKMLKDKGVRVSGIDINQDNIVKCLEKGLSVIQGDIDEGLQEYPDGKMPKSNILPFEWYDTPNIHLLTIKDFYDFAKRHNFRIEKKLCMTRARIRKSLFHKLFDNLFTEEVIFLCTKN